MVLHRTVRYIHIGKSKKKRTTQPVKAKHAYILTHQQLIIAMVKHVKIDVSNRDSDVILGEIHSVKLGAEGLMGVPARLGYTPSSLLCFPPKDEMGDLTNRGDSFTTICNLFLQNPKPIFNCNTTA